MNPNPPVSLPFDSVRFAVPTSTSRLRTRIFTHPGLIEKLVRFDTTVTFRLHTLGKKCGEISLKQPSDDALMNEIRQGRPDALGILFDRYYRLVFDVARRILRNRTEAEDLMQDVFIEVFRKAALYDSNK